MVGRVIGFLPCASGANQGIFKRKSDVIKDILGVTGDTLVATLQFAQDLLWFWVKPAASGARDSFEV
jgi:hypothetical protein